MKTDGSCKMEIAITEENDQRKELGGGGFRPVANKIWQEAQHVARDDRILVKLAQKVRDPSRDVVLVAKLDIIGTIAEPGQVSQVSAAGQEGPHARLVSNEGGIHQGRPPARRLAAKINPRVSQQPPQDSLSPCLYGIVGQCLANMIWLIQVHTGVPQQQQHHVITLQREGESQGAPPVLICGSDLQAREPRCDGGNLLTGRPRHQGFTKQSTSDNFCHSLVSQGF